jgi:hypothetical protein
MSKVTTKSAVRLSYTSLLEPRAQNAEKPEELAYSTAILIPKTDKETVKAIKGAIKEALADGVAKKWGGKTPPNLKNPLRDGDTERPDDEVYAGMFFINAKGPRGGKEKAILLDSKGNETVDASIIYSGVEARVSIQFYAFDKAGNKGVACGVTAVQSLETGEPLGNTVTASGARSDFGISTPASSAADYFKGTSAAADEDDDDDDDDPWAA